MPEMQTKLTLREVRRARTTILRRLSKAHRMANKDLTDLQTRCPHEWKRGACPASAKVTGYECFSCGRQVDELPETN